MGFGSRVLKLGEVSERSVWFTAPTLKLPPPNPSSIDPLFWYPSHIRSDTFIVHRSQILYFGTPLIYDLTHLLTHLQNVGFLAEVSFCNGRWD